MTLKSALGAAAVFGLAASASAAPATSVKAGRMSISADRIAADRETSAFVASGHVYAVNGPVRLRGECASRDAEGTIHLADPASVTTCSNEVGHLHWSVTGDVTYRDKDSVILRDMVVRFWEVPIFWLPYWYHPIQDDLGLQVMFGYTGRWGAYMLSRYSYNLLGDADHAESSYWLDGATHFDLRYRNGVAVGEDFDWQLGDFGRGYFKVYYAYDLRSDVYDTSATTPYNNDMNWGSSVPKNRYAIEFGHRWQATERDTLRVLGYLTSDSNFRHDMFLKPGEFLNIENRFSSGRHNEAAWEHVENWFGAGISASGPLNDFFGGTYRLPEVYFDVNPLPVFSTGLNYESSTRIGFIGRRAAYYDGALPVYRYNPGPWADYECIRGDTYHRLTYPFKVWDILSVVPRVAYRGTFWSASGESSGSAEVDSLSQAGDGGSTWRSVIEGGVTFAARGTAWIDERWQHMLEPYVDVLCQEAVYSGLSGDGRPYVFDNFDASMCWEDQFAGRGRNLPYSYYGATPGLRNTFRTVDDRGNLSTVFDFDAYVAFQFNSGSWNSDDEDVRSAEAGEPNYGDHTPFLMPGFRTRWLPSDDTALSLRSEFDLERGKIALVNLDWQQRLLENFRYDVALISRYSRYWDYASMPTSATMMRNNVNWLDFCIVRVGFEHELCDAFSWGPFIRWDCRDGELDTVGSFFDYHTDCLGFRLTVEYSDGFTRIDGTEYEEDFGVGFYVYLRAFGEDLALGGGGR